VRPQVACATYQCRSVFISMSVPQHVVRQRSVGRSINSRPGVEFHRRLSPRQPPNVRENAHNWKSDDCVDDRFHAVQKWPLATFAPLAAAHAGARFTTSWLRSKVSEWSTRLMWEGRGQPRYGCTLGNKRTLPSGTLRIRMAVVISIKRLNRSQTTLFYMNQTLQHKLDPCSLVGQP